MAAPPEVITEARRLFGLGYQVIAVRADKRPWGKDWRRIHTLDEVIRLLEGPECVAIGFLGGEFNYWIVPVDFDKKTGDDWFRTHCLDHGIDPDDFPTVLTSWRVQPDGSLWRGRHRYMSDRRHILGNSTGPALASLSIDIRAKGMSVLPPSPHASGIVYEWAKGHSLDDFPDGIPPVPDFLYDAILERGQPAQEGQEAPQEKRDAPGEKRDAPGEKRDAPGEKRDAPGEKRDAPGEKRDATPPGRGPQAHWRPHTAPPPPSQEARAEAYCRGALENARTRLAAVVAPGRNIALNNEALGLGHLAHFGVFTEGEAKSQLMAACEANGLLADKQNGGTLKCHATFTSGWRKGLTEPKDLPPEEVRRAEPSNPWSQFHKARSSTDRPEGAGRSESHEEQHQEEAREETADQSEAKEPAAWRRFVRLSDDLRTMPAKDLDYLVTGWLPKVWLYVLNGDGGAGKTTLLMQLFEALGAGYPFLGMATQQCRPLMLMSEEDENLTALKTRLLPPGGPSLFMPLQDWPGPTELVATLRDGQIQPQPFLDTLCEMIGDLRPDIVSLDHAGDFFLINQNSQLEVNGALLFLRPLAAEFKTSFFLSQHISKAGMASGRYDAGTTQWHNKSRWRGALYPPGLSEEADEGEQVQALRAATRKFEIVKDNYGGRRGHFRILRWEAGSFVLDQGELDKAKASSLDDRLLAFALRILPAADNRRIPLAMNAGTGMVAQFIAAMSLKRGHGPEVYESLLRLIAAGKLGRKDEGPPSRLRSYVVLPEEK
jgi:hypothetical protein